MDIFGTKRKGKLAMFWHIEGKSHGVIRHIYWSQASVEYELWTIGADGQPGEHLETTNMRDKAVARITYLDERLEESLERD